MVVTHQIWPPFIHGYWFAPIIICNYLHPRPGSQRKTCLDQSPFTQWPDCSLSSLNQRALRNWTYYWHFLPYYLGPYQMLVLLNSAFFIFEFLGLSNWILNCSEQSNWCRCSNQLRLKMQLDQKVLWLLASLEGPGTPNLDGQTLDYSTVWGPACFGQLVCCEHWGDCLAVNGRNLAKDDSRTCLISD